MKEHLSARAVEFESINVAEDETGLDRVRALGMRGVPVVARGDRAVYAQDLADVDDFLGISSERRGVLAPDVLIDRYVRILDVAVKAARLIPTARLEDELPGRHRSYLQLVNHIVEIAAGFVEVSRGAALDGAIAEAEPNPGLRIHELRSHADSVARDLAALQGMDAGAWKREVDTWYGRKTLHAVLERCTWHSAQHTRQLMMVLDILEIEAQDPLTDGDLAGLPLPDQVWD